MHPFLHLTGTFFVPTYLLVISFTYCLSLIWADRRAARFNRSRALTLDIALMIMIGGFLGARLFHVLYEAPEVYFENPVRIFKFWEGGFVFYGGFLGALLTSSIFLKIKKESFWQWADFYAPILALGYALGRIGCFMNGCCYGETCDLPWAVEFHTPGLPIGPRHPTQLYATFFELVTLTILLFTEKTKWLKQKRFGTLFCLWLALHAIGRLVMEAFRDDFRGPEFGLSISSWLSLTLLTIALAILVTKPQPKSAK